MSKPTKAFLHRELTLSQQELSRREARIIELLMALHDARIFIDRLQNTKDDGWTHADALRLDRIRSLAAGEGFSVAAVAAAAQRETGAVESEPPLPRKFRRHP